jgi:hypothetical protein
LLADPSWVINGCLSKVRCFELQGLFWELEGSDLKVEAPSGLLLAASLLFLALFLLWLFAEKKLMRDCIVELYGFSTSRKGETTLHFCDKAASTAEIRYNAE